MFLVVIFHRTIDLVAPGDEIKCERVGGPRLERRGQLSLDAVALDLETVSYLASIGNNE